MNELRKRARERRKELGLSQTEAAQRAGMSLRAYQNFESGQTKPQEDNLDGIIRALGLAEEQEVIAEETRSEWPRDVQVYLDMVGAYLATLDDETRIQWMREQTRKIFVPREDNSH